MLCCHRFYIGAVSVRGAASAARVTVAGSKRQQHKRDNRCEFKMLDFAKVHAASYQVGSANRRND